MAMENKRLANQLEQLHEENPDKGYRRLNDNLHHDHDIHVNDKRVLRLCRARGIRSTVKYAIYCREPFEPAIPRRTA